MKNLVLVGFMGTGKTRIGRMLAEELDMSFVDTDDVISARFGMSVSDIFSRFGEEVFRAAEKEAIAEASARSSQVIATGGGAVENEENIANLRSGGVVVCLSALPEIILARTSRNNDRPMLETGEDRITRIKTLLERRRPLYACADYEVDTTHNNPEVTTQLILRYYKEHENR